MEGILENFRRVTRRVAAPTAAVDGPPPAAGLALLLPGREAGEWELCRRVASGVPDASPANTTRQVFPSIAEAAANLSDMDSFVVALPVEAGLVQRMILPAAEPSELEEMARIQLEKVLPYPVELVSVATQEISRTETDVTLAVESIHQDRLMEFCQPVVDRDCWPRKVAFLPLILADSAPPDETTAFIYRAAGRYVLGICEAGKLVFAQTLGGQSAEELATELPAVLLGAELEGVPTAFTRVRLEEKSAEWRDVLTAALGVPVEAVDMEGAALLAAARPGGDLSPVEWHAERQRGERRARLRRQFLVGAAIYGGILLFAFLLLGVRKIQVARLDSKLAAIRPQAAYSRDANARWRTLSPAVEPAQSLVEVLKTVTDCLPPGNTVLLTGFDLSPRGLSIQGEAPSSAAAIEFTDKLETLPQLRAYRLHAEPPVIQSNNRWRFQSVTANPST